MLTGKLTRLLALFTLLCLLPGCSLALRCGDRSEEVKNLQQMLFETGWLFEEPDGIFGRNTENAVRNYERFAGLPADGVADEQMLEALTESWVQLMVETGQLTAGEGVLADGRYPAVCTHDVTDGVSLTEYCAVHDALHTQAQTLILSGKAEQAVQLWLAEIKRLYGLWLDRTDGSQHAAITAARDGFLSTADAQLTAIRGFYATFQLEPEDNEAQLALEIQLRGHAAWLCALISGALTAPEVGL